MTDETEFMAPSIPGEQRAALVVGGSVGAIIPQSVEEVWRLSNVFHRSGMAPQSLNSPEKVMVAIIAGAELGLAPFQAMSSFGIIGGRPVLFGDGMLAVIRSRGFRIREWSQGSDDERIAHCEVTRPDNGEVVKRSFSVADAKVAGLWKKSGPWTTNPGRMLQMRSRAFACRDAAADVLRGFQMREEVEDYQEARDVTPAPKSSVGERLAARSALSTEGFTVENGQHVSAALDEILDNDNFPVANLDPTGEPEPQPEPQKRKRRTKAEMEAAKAAEAAAEPDIETDTNYGEVVNSLDETTTSPDIDADTEAAAETVGESSPASELEPDGSTAGGEDEDDAGESSLDTSDGSSALDDLPVLTPEESAYSYALGVAETFEEAKTALVAFRRTDVFRSATGPDQVAWQIMCYDRTQEMASNGVAVPSPHLSPWFFSLWLIWAKDTAKDQIPKIFAALKKSPAYLALNEAQQNGLIAGTEQALA